MSAYHYRESGLDNVLIEGVMPCKDDEGFDVVTIPNIAGLHATIAEGIVTHRAGMSGKELRFLRSEMGMTQAQLAQVVHHDAQSLGRWERGEFPMEPVAEALIRLLAIEALNLHVKHSTIVELSQMCTPSAEPQRILIDGHDPSHYKLAA
jgi:DNA-binding transcriptional regulator YiaG